MHWMQDKCDSRQTHALELIYQHAITCYCSKNGHIPQNTTASGHKPWPWRPQQWRHEKLTPNVQLISQISPSWSSWFVAVIVEPRTNYDAGSADATLSNTRTASSSSIRASRMLSTASNPALSNRVNVCGRNSIRAATVSSPQSSSAFFTTCSSFGSQINYSHQPNNHKQFCAEDSFMQKKKIFQFVYIAISFYERLNVYGFLLKFRHHLYPASQINWMCIFNRLAFVTKMRIVNWNWSVSTTAVKHQ